MNPDLTRLIQLQRLDDATALARARIDAFPSETAALEEVGQSFAVTRERIRQIEAKALRKLRHPSRSRKLRAFLEGRT